MAAFLISFQNSLTGEQITCPDFCSCFCLSDSGSYLVVQIFSPSPSNKGLLLTQTWTKRRCGQYLASHEKCPCSLPGGDQEGSESLIFIPAGTFQGLYSLFRILGFCMPCDSWNSLILLWGWCKDFMCLDVDFIVLQIVGILHVRQEVLLIIHHNLKIWVWFLSLL